MVNILKRLDRDKFAPVVCVSKKGGFLDTEVDKLGLPFIEAEFTVPLKPYTGLYSRARRAAQVFRPYQFVLWHSFHYADNYSEPIIAFLSGTKKYIYTKKGMGWGSRAWTLKSFLSTRIIVDNSEMPHLMFDRFGLRKKTWLVHHGVETDHYLPGLLPRLNLREQYSIPVSSVIVSIVAHLLPVKGHITLLQAMADVPSAHLLVAGKPLDAAYAGTLHMLVTDLGMNDRIDFMGGISDIPALLTESDIFVLSTVNPGEGCPVALLEAMSSGKACVASDVPGVRDLIIHGESGLLVPPENASALANAIHQLIENPELRTTMGQAARRRVEQNFTVDHEVGKHEALYADILGWR